MKQWENNSSQAENRPFLTLVSKILKTNQNAYSHLSQTAKMAYISYLYIFRQAIRAGQKDKYGYFFEFKNKDLADILNSPYRKAVLAKKELINKSLVCQRLMGVNKKTGLGLPNRLYLKNSTTRPTGNLKQAC